MMVITYAGVVDVVSKVLLALAIIAGAVCVIDWAIRARKISPFSAIARFFRRTVDPLMRPVEARVVRYGGQPAAAPLWVFVGIAVAGILILQLIRIIGELVIELSRASANPARIPVLLVVWALQFLYVAIIVRVFSSWLPISPYSGWVRWSYLSTEWILAPIRRIIPPFRGLDLSAIAALVLIWFVRGIVS